MFPKKSTTISDSVRKIPCPSSKCSSRQPWAIKTWGTRAWGTRAWATRAWGTKTWGTRAWGTKTWGTRAWATRTWARDRFTWARCQGTWKLPCQYTSLSHQVMLIYTCLIPIPISMVWESNTWYTWWVCTNWRYTFSCLLSLIQKTSRFTVV